MHYAVIGSRTFENYTVLKTVLNKMVTASDTIVSGGAKGADTLAVNYAIESKINYIELLPDWSTHGKSAGFIRNAEIIDKSHFIIAFHDGKSRGTLHSLALAKEQKKPTLIIYF